MAFIILLLSNVLFFTALQATRPIVSLHAVMLETSPLVIGLLIACYALFPMLLALSVGKWLDRYGARRLALLGGMGLFLALLLPALVPTIYMLFVSQLLLGLFQVSLLVSYQKTVGNLPGNRDKNIMWLSLTIASGEFLGPLLGGFSYEYYGFEWTFALSAFLIIVGVVLAVFVHKDTWRGAVGSNKPNGVSSG